MSIVTLTVNPSTARIRYGIASFRPSPDGSLEVPSYVAKPLLALNGVTGPAIPQTSAALLAAVEEDFETNYLFWAYGVPLPDENRQALASELLAANGDPAVSLS